MFLTKNSQPSEIQSPNQTNILPKNPLSEQISPLNNKTNESMYIRRDEFEKAIYKLLDVLQKFQETKLKESMKKTREGTVGTTDFSEPKTNKPVEKVNEAKFTESYQSNDLFMIRKVKKEQNRNNLPDWAKLLIANFKQ